MKRIKLMVLMGFFLVTLSGCVNEPNFPRIHYENSGSTFDFESRYIEVRDGYELSQSTPYNEVETENGYDIVIHCVKGE